jgi:hypothetical protein
VAVGTFDDLSIPRGERRSYSFTVGEGGSIEPGPEFNSSTSAIDGRQVRGQLIGPGGYEDFEVTGEIIRYALPPELKFYGGAPSGAVDASGSGENGSGGGGSGKSEFAEGYGETLPPQAVPVVDTTDAGFVVDGSQPQTGGSLPPGFSTGAQVALASPEDSYGRYTIQGFEPARGSRRSVIVTDPAPGEIDRQAVTYAPEIHLFPPGAEEGGGQIISGVPNSTLYIGGGIAAAVAVVAVAS